MLLDAMRVHDPSMAAAPIAIPAATPRRRMSVHMEIAVESRI
ncbi:hypothetical protein [Burkholderia cepacia]|nr:hypothetical protein [Burkholderia cepacia]